jgi:hypothetical protein
MNGKMELGQLVRVTNFIHKNWHVFCSKNEITLNVNATSDGTVAEVVKCGYIYHNSSLSFTLNIVTRVFCTPYGTLTL